MDNKQHNTNSTEKSNTTGSLVLPVAAAGPPALLSSVPSVQQEQQEQLEEQAVSSGTATAAALAVVCRCCNGRGNPDNRYCNVIYPYAGAHRRAQYRKSKKKERQQAKLYRLIHSTTASTLGTAFNTLADTVGNSGRHAMENHGRRQLSDSFASMFSSPTPSSMARNRQALMSAPPQRARRSQFGSPPFGQSQFGSPPFSQLQPSHGQAPMSAPPQHGALQLPGPQFTSQQLPPPHSASPQQQLWQQAATQAPTSARQSHLPSTPLQQQTLPQTMDMDESMDMDEEAVPLLSPEPENKKTKRNRSKKRRIRANQRRRKSEEKAAAATSGDGSSDDERPAKRARTEDHPSGQRPSGQAIIAPAAPTNNQDAIPAPALPAQADAPTVATTSAQSTATTSSIPAPAAPTNYQDAIPAPALPAPADAPTVATTSAPTVATTIAQSTATTSSTSASTSGSGSASAPSGSGNGSASTSGNGSAPTSDSLSLMLVGSNSSDEDDSSAPPSNGDGTSDSRALVLVDSNSSDGDESSTPLSNGDGTSDSRALVLVDSNSSDGDDEEDDQVVPYSSREVALPAIEGLLMAIPEEFDRIRRLYPDMLVQQQIQLAEANINLAMNFGARRVELRQREEEHEDNMEMKHQEHEDNMEMKHQDKAMKLGNVRKHLYDAVSQGVLYVCLACSTVACARHHYIMLNERGICYYINILTPSMFVGETDVVEQRWYHWVLFPSVASGAADSCILPTVWVAFCGLVFSGIAHISGPVMQGIELLVVILFLSFKLLENQLNKLFLCTAVLLVIQASLLHMRNLHKLNKQTSSFATFTSTDIAAAYTEYYNTAVKIWYLQFLLVFVFIVCLEVIGWDGRTS